MTAGIEQHSTFDAFARKRAPLAPKSRVKRADEKHDSRSTSVASFRRRATTVVRLTCCFSLRCTLRAELVRQGRAGLVPRRRRELCF
jgi:hypothetical protein